jgi:hypothetical protein
MSNYTVGPNAKGTTKEEMIEHIMDAVSELIDQTETFKSNNPTESLSGSVLYDIWANKMCDKGFLKREDKLQEVIAIPTEMIAQIIQ